MEINFSIPEKHIKSWGYELWINNNPKYCGKILHINKGKKFSLHYHLIKEESQYLYSGKLLLTYLDLRNAKKIEKEISIGEIINIPIGQPHQLLAVEESEIFEISTTHYEEDSYRIER